MTSKYPTFISRVHVLAFIKEKDPEFAKKLKDEQQEFSWNGCYYTPSMGGYLLRIPFTYNPQPKEFGLKQFKGFNEMKKHELV